MSKEINPFDTAEAIFPPSAEFSQKARISSIEQYEEMYRHSIENPESFWAQEAQDLDWRAPWSKVLDWQVPHAKWFVDAKVNVCENCVDRHAKGARKDKVAIYFEGEPGDQRAITYGELLLEVSRFANVLEQQGVKAGDRVLIYMPMIPEAAFAMLACARIGAVHSVVFGGFASEAIVDRLEDSGAEVIVTADGGWRRGKVVPLKPVVDVALEKVPSVRKVIVVERAKNSVAMTEGRDLWYHQASASVSDTHQAPALDAEHPLFVLYTSGSTGKPKGILHTSGGYLMGTYATCKYIFDMRDDDVYWCTADVGWITGHSYIVYGPLANGVTQVMYEGAPNQPDYGRFWQIIEKYKVSIFYTAPTAIRAFIKAGDQFPEAHDLSSLRLLGSVGEPINPEAWMWYYRKIGGSRCPIVDTWWQTETGSIMISPMPGATHCKPGTATKPFFGVDASIFDDHGKPSGPNEDGRLVIRQPWPAMARTIYGDAERYEKTYWSDYPGIYTAGDSSRRGLAGNFWIIGRLDDVLNVSGHRLGTAEIESVLAHHEGVAESAVVGRPDDLKGQAVVAFVVLKSGVEATEALRSEVRNHVGKLIGAIAKPDDVHFIPSLPKTRSGKIMRRLLKELVLKGEITGNTTTLEDPAVLDKIREAMAAVLPA